jgi:hypothetical protein
MTHIRPVRFGLIPILEKTTPCVLAGLNPAIQTPARRTMILRPDTLSQTNQTRSQNRLQTGAIRFGAPACGILLGKPHPQIT